MAIRSDVGLVTLQGFRASTEMPPEEFTQNKRHDVCQDDDRKRYDPIAFHESVPIRIDTPKQRTLRNRREDLGHHQVTIS
jgi:hypothetical protein